MITGLLYGLLIVGLVWYNRFFGLFRDEQIGNRKLAGLLLIKFAAIPAFYYFYENINGGITKFDAGKFFHDAVLLKQYGCAHPGELVRMMFGWQNDVPGAQTFKDCYDLTQNWNVGRTGDFFPNDNRAVIRLHVLLDFLANGSYFAHAVLSCFLSFVGLHWIGRSLRLFIGQRAMWFMLVGCMFPSLWFYTGGVLKEGPTIFVVGALLYSLMRVTESGFSFSRIVAFFLALSAGLVLRPYQVMPLMLCSALYISLNRFKIRWVSSIIALVITSVLLLLANGVLLILKDTNFREVAIQQRKTFLINANGGIFLSSGQRFVRMDFDPSMIKKMNSGDSLYTIRRGAKYSYWEDSHPHDSLYCSSNADTARVYILVDISPPARSTIPGSLEGQPGWLRGIRDALFYPPFYRPAGGMASVACIENLLILLLLLVIVIGALNRRTDLLFLSSVIIFTAVVSAIIGISSPNTGAIMRYRAPLVLFMAAAALHVIDVHLSGRRVNDKSVY